MIVYLSGSLRDKKVDPEYLGKVIAAIHKSGGVLALDWFDAALLRLEKSVKVKNWTTFVNNNFEALKNADIVIIEGTHYAFSQGFLTAAAIEHKKPTLLISRDSLIGKSASGIANELFSWKLYSNDNELEKIIKNFMVKNKVHTKELRFNIFFTRRIQKFLDKTAQESNKSRSEVIRDIIKRQAGQEHRE